MLPARDNARASTTIMADFRDVEVPRHRRAATSRRGARARCDAEGAEGVFGRSGRRVSTRRGKLMTLTAPPFEQYAVEPPGLSD
jgi:hypothetical protein